MSLYSDLPETLKKQAKEKLGLNVSVAKDFVQNFLKARVPPRTALELDVLKKASLVLDNSCIIKPKGKRQWKKRSALTSNVKRQIRIHDITKDAGSYEMYLPLHDLWLQYFREVMELKNLKLIQNADKTHLYSKLLKADYHGCIMTVTRSKCPSYIGVSGILLQETRNVMRFMMKNNVLKTIPKFNSVFTFEVDGFTFTIYGNQFRVKSSERAVKKFKSKPTLYL